MWVSIPRRTSTRIIEATGFTTIDDPLESRDVNGIQRANRLLLGDVGKILVVGLSECDSPWRV